jgi:hypothetical protein
MVYRLENEGYIQIFFLKEVCGRGGKIIGYRLFCVFVCSLGMRVDERVLLRLIVGAIPSFLCLIFLVMWMCRWT